MTASPRVSFDAANDCLRTSDSEVALPWRVARFLEMLVAADGGLVPREKAQNELWPNVVVTRNSFDQLLAQARRSLQEAGIDPEVLETVPRQGCRLKFRFAADTPTSPSRTLRLAGGATLLLAAGVFGWMLLPQPDFTCQLQGLPLSLAPDSNEGIMHVFHSNADFEAFRQEQEAAGKVVRVNGEIVLAADAAAVIACVEN